MREEIIVVKVISSFDGVSFTIYPQSMKWTIHKPIGDDPKLTELMKNKTFRFFKARIVLGDRSVLELLTDQECPQHFH